ncbi:MAG: MATE family efflux transporter [Prevotella sp.]|nr:MATE family efflux transporter [Prevotella sp.]
MPNQNSERVAKNTGFMFIRMLVVVGVGLFTSREVLRVLGVNDFGIYNLVGTIVVMFTFLQTALNNATSRFITYDLGAGNTANLQRIFSMSMNTELILAGIIMLLSEIVGVWFIGNKLHIPDGRMEAAQWVFQISLFNFAISIIRTPYNSLIIAHEHMNYYALTSIIEAVLKLVIVYLLIVLPADKLILYALLQMGVTIVIFLWMVVYCKHHFEECHYTKYWNKGLLKSLMNYSGWSLIVNIADIAVNQSISIFFNLFYGIAANAAYGIANQVNTQLSYFISNFSQSYSPQIIKSYAAKKYDYFMKLIYSTSKLTFFLYFSVAFPIMINIRFILDVWLVNPPKMADTFLCLIVGYNIFDSFSNPLWMSVHATGYLKVHQILMGSIKIMNIPISYILLKLGFPIYTVLAVYVALNALCSIVRIIYLRTLIHLDTLDYMKKVIWQMIKIVLISIPIPLAILYFSDNRLLNFFMTSISFYLLYLPSIYFLALNTKEKEIVKGIVVKVIAKVKR